MWPQTDLGKSQSLSYVCKKKTTKKTRDGKNSKSVHDSSVHSRKIRNDDSLDRVDVLSPSLKHNESRIRPAHAELAAEVSTDLCFGNSTLLYLYREPFSQGAFAPEALY